MCTIFSAHKIEGRCFLPLKVKSPMVERSRLGREGLKALELSRVGDCGAACHEWGKGDEE